MLSHRHGCRHQLPALFPLVQCLHLSTAQRTLVETWGIVGESFVDPTFNNHDWQVGCMCMGGQASWKGMQHVHVGRRTTGPATMTGREAVMGRAGSTRSMPHAHACTLLLSLKAHKRPHLILISQDELREHMMAAYTADEDPGRAWDEINAMLSELGDPYTRRIEPE